MTRSAPLVFLCLLLAACIPVNDFGAYWAKGVLDPALAGVWDEIPVKADAPEQARKVALKVALQGDTYIIDSMDEEELRKEDYAPMTAKTLHAGDYAFLMIREGNKTGPGGDFIRYALKDDVFIGYELDTKKVGVLLKEASDWSIETLDDTAYAVLARIPDTAEYWKPQVRYSRHTD